MKILKILIVGVCVVIIGYFLGKQFGLIKDNPTISHSSEKTINQIAEDINEKLPIQVDPNTLWVKFYISNNTAIYEYKIINTNIDFDNVSTNDLNDFSHELYLQLKNSLCSNYGMKDFLDKGVIFNYRYLSEQGKEVSNITLIKSDCLK